MAMDPHLQDQEERMLHSLENISSLLAGLIPGITTIKGLGFTQPAASFSFSRFGAAQQVSIRAHDLVLNIDPRWAGGVVICYDGRLQIESETLGPREIKANEILILGRKSVQIGGLQWTAHFPAFDYSAEFTKRADLERHGVRADHDSDHLIINQTQNGAIELRRRAFLSLMDYIRLFHNGKCAIPASFEIDILLAKHIIWLASKAIDKGDHLNTQGLTGRAVPKILQAIATEITENCMAYQSLDELTARSGYSKRQLQHLFNLHYHTTPMQFIKQARLIAASNRLHSPQHRDSVGKIGESFGWRHASSFSTEFKRQFGISPSAILRNAKQQPLRITACFPRSDGPKGENKGER